MTCRSIVIVGATLAFTCIGSSHSVAQTTQDEPGPRVTGVEITASGGVLLTFDVDGVKRSIPLPSAMIDGIGSQLKAARAAPSSTSPNKPGPDKASREPGLAVVTSPVNGITYQYELIPDSVMTIRYQDAGNTETIVLPVDVAETMVLHHRQLSGRVPQETQVYFEPRTGAFWFSVSSGFNYKAAALVLSLILAAIVFGAVHVSTRRIRRERDDLRASRRRMMRIREAERSHLASELHDGPVQDVQRILRSNLSSLARVIPTSDSDDLSELESTLRQIAGNLRDICTDLKPPVLAHFGLEKAAESVTRSFQLRNPDVTVETQFSLGPDDLSEESRLVLYRILQEALNNTEKHAGASSVRVDLTIRDDEVQLIVEDNGRGFRPSRRLTRLEERGHFGLSGMRQRVDSVGGTLYVDSAVGKGTRITVLVPAYSNEDMSLPMSERIL